MQVYRVEPPERTVSTIFSCNIDGCFMYVHEQARRKVLQLFYLELTQFPMSK